MNQKLKKQIVKSLAVLFSAAAFLTTANSLVHVGASKFNIHSINNPIIIFTAPVDDPDDFLLQHIREDGQRPVLIIQDSEGVETFYDVNDRDSLGRTPIMLTIWDKELVELLIQNGANINDKDHKGTSVLMHAIVNNKLEIVNLLLEHNADINAKDTLDRNALTYSVINNNNEIVNVLLEHVARMNPQHPSDAVKKYIDDGMAFAVAVRKNYTEIAQNLLEHGANINLYPSLYGNSIFDALKNNNSTIIELLIKHDNLNTYDISEALSYYETFTDDENKDETSKHNVELLKNYYRTKEGREWQFI